MENFIKLILIKIFFILGRNIRDFSYVFSNRGTKQVLFDGNTYTPNSKENTELKYRTYKCAQYYKKKCNGRIAIRVVDNREYLKVVFNDHTHEPTHPGKNNVWDANY